MRRITEEASLYDDLEHKPIAELLRDINREDHRVAEAVEQALPQITRLTEAVAARMEQGGRLFYIGAATSGRLGVLDASEPATYLRHGSTVGGRLDCRWRHCSPACRGAC